jgi:uncharacterized membrane protein YeiH
MPVVPPLAETPLFLVLAYAGVAVFAATGALAAAAQKHDIITFVFFAAITGVGGGTLRDLLLDVPIFWIVDPNFLTVSAVVGALVWLFGVRRWTLPALLWLDAIGLAAFAVLGAAKAVALGISGPVAVVMGVLTATAGGIIRDMTAGVPSILLRREIYVTAALLGATVFAALDTVVSRELASLLGFAAALILRATALIFGLSLPGFFGGLGTRRGSGPS